MRATDKGPSRMAIFLWAQQWGSTQRRASNRSTRCLPPRRSCRPPCLCRGDAARAGWSSGAVAVFMRHGQAESEPVVRAGSAKRLKYDTVLQKRFVVSPLQLQVELVVSSAPRAEPRCSCPRLRGQPRPIRPLYRSQPKYTVCSARAGGTATMFGGPPSTLLYCSRNAAQPHARRSVNDGRTGNNDVQRAARAQRGGGGRLPRAVAARNKDMIARPRPRYELGGCALATTPCRSGRLMAARLPLARDADDCARPWRAQRAARRQGPSRGYYARAAACVGHARATRRQ